jgi:hypothetical protein
LRGQDNVEEVWMATVTAVESRKARTSEAIASRSTEIRTTPPGRS